MSTIERTVRYIAGKSGIDLEANAEHHLRGTGPRVACETVAGVLELHGLTTMITDHADGAAIDVDLMACPPDATPEEREQLADQCAAESGATAAAEWEATVERGEQTSGRWVAEERAEDNEWRWCMQQTLVFLRRRAAPTPTTSRDGNTDGARDRLGTGPTT